MVHGNCLTSFQQSDLTQSSGRATSSHGTSCTASGFQQNDLAQSSGRITNTLINAIELTFPTKRFNLVVGKRGFVLLGLLTNKVEFPAKRLDPVVGKRWDSNSIESTNRQCFQQNDLTQSSGSIVEFTDYGMACWFSTKRLDPVAGKLIF